MPTATGGAPGAGDSAGAESRAEMMTKRNLIASLFLIGFALLAGCRAAPGPEAPESPSPAPVETPAPATPSPTPEPDPVEEALSAMTTEEKVGQLLIAGFYGTQAGEEVRSYIQDLHVGGVILYGRNVESAGQLLELTNGLKALAEDGIPLLISTDQEGGLVERMPPEVHRLPNAYHFGQIDDPEARMNACFTLGQTLAAQCATFGINMDFAPVMDIWSNPDNTVIGERAFGSDAATVTGAANETALGILSGGVIPVAKHFPGHGDTETDSHLGLPVVDKTKEELLDFELRPFRQAIDTTCVFGTYGGDTSIPAIMVGHILVSQIDPERPASLSPAVVTGLLREELGFDGVVVTDDLTMGAVTQSYGLGEAAVLAVEAGCDLLLVCHEEGSVEEAYTALLEAVDSGRLSQDRLDQSVRRILALKQDYGVTSDPVEAPDLEALNALVDAAW